MKQVQAEVIANDEVLPGLRLMWLDAPEAARLVRPGQFLFAKCSSGPEPFLRRPISIHRVAPGILPQDERTGPPTQIAILFGASGLGTGYLSRHQPGDIVDIIAPLGRGFVVHPDTRNVLLVGGGWGVAPLINLADFCLRDGRSVTLLLGAQSSRQVIPLNLLPPDVEVLVTTQDGSMGVKGVVTDVLASQLDWADEVFCCGPAPMYRAIAAVARGRLPRRRVQVLADAPMACGVGVCGTCVVAMARRSMCGTCSGSRGRLSPLPGSERTVAWRAAGET
ncbi:MAG: dihydroorotate dehydrogenase electron transfer subunit [Chloroflexi bacterium]|nr:dihydroorotate dehydrogenase electron transfer subunit [Chloroflexota bacterium]